MSEYSVEEVRQRAATVFGVAGNMLTTYADLLEQIERAREGVTDEVAKAVWNSAAKASPFHNHYSIDSKADLKTALHAVVHLLPSDERGGVEKPVVLAWLEAEPSATLESLRSETGMFIHSMQFHVGKTKPADRPAANKLFPLYTRPPAQVAQAGSGVVNALQAFITFADEREAELGDLSPELREVREQGRNALAVPPRAVPDVVRQVLKRYQDGRVFSNPHTRQVARAIEQEIDAAPSQGEPS
jgi:hypothetical protein